MEPRTVIVVLIRMILICSDFFFFNLTYCLCFLSSLPVSRDCLWGWGGETEPVPCGEGLGLGSGTVRLCTPQRPLRATVFQHLPGGQGPGSLAQIPQSLGTCPRSRHRRCLWAGPQPDCASGAPSLCTKITREIPSGTLRKVGGSEPARTGRGGAGAVPAAEAGASLARRRAAAIAGTGKGRWEPGCRETRASSSAGWLSCLSFPRWRGGNSRMAKGLRF